MPSAGSYWDWGGRRAHYGGNQLYPPGFPSASRGGRQAQKKPVTLLRATGFSGSPKEE